MSYVQESLMRGETIVYQGRISMWAMGPRITVGCLLMLLGVAGAARGVTGVEVFSFLMGAAMFGTAMIAYLTTELALTNRRVIAKFGVIRRQSVELKLERVESVQVKQGIVGRMFDYGSLIVAGAGAPSAPVPGVSNPMEFRRMVFEAQETSQTPPTLKLAA